MSNKLSNKHLLYLLVLLLAVIFGYKFLNINKGVKSFPDEVVEIDSNLVTQISIYPKATQYKEVKIFQKGQSWMIDLGNNETAVIPHEKIQGLFKDLLGMKPERLAATRRKKWKEFEVDSSGTRVKVYQGEKLAADLVIGRFSFNQQLRSATSYFRVFNDSNVYALNGFLEFTFNQNHNGWRDNNLIKLDKNSILQLNFVYPDSSYSIIKKDNAWVTTEGQSMDSVQVDSYLSAISNLRGSEFVDGIDMDQLREPNFSLRIETFDSGTIKVDAYIDSSRSLIISNLNPTSCFDPSGGNLIKKLFLGKGHFQKLL